MIPRDTGGLYGEPPTRTPQGSEPRARFHLYHFFELISRLDIRIEGVVEFSRYFVGLLVL